MRRTAIPFSVPFALPIGWLPCLLLVSAMVGGGAAQDALVAQDLNAVSPPVNDSSTKTIQLTGLVTDQKKYEFTVQHEEGESVVRMAENAPIALSLHKPWFDWAEKRVYVDPKTLDESPLRGKQRIPYPLRQAPLYLICRFRNAAHMERIMAPEIKRLNVYLVTPEPLEPHPPTKEEHYLAGQIKIGAQPDDVRLQVGDQLHRIHLGFRTATLTGFSIADLAPGTTRVVLTGTRNEQTGKILATSVAFEPVVPTGIPGR